jgi:hypothetical protein
MIAITLTFSILFVAFALILGAVVGWIYRENMWTVRPNIHPEMFDENGNLIADEVWAIRVESADSEDDDSED